MQAPFLLCFSNRMRIRELCTKAHEIRSSVHTKRTAPGEWQERDRERVGEGAEVLSAQIWYGICNLFALKLELSSHPTATQESQHVRKKCTEMACARGWYNLAATKMLHAFCCGNCVSCCNDDNNGIDNGSGAFRCTQLLYYIISKPQSQRRACDYLLSTGITFRLALAGKIPGGSTKNVYCVFQSSIACTNSHILLRFNALCCCCCG